MAFFQAPPVLGNQYDDDRVLRSYLDRVWPATDGDRRAAREEMASLGAWAGGPGYEMLLADRENEPVLTTWDPWGRRVDRIAVTPLWREAAKIAVKYGLIGTAYERAFGEASRIAQFAKVYLFDPSSDVYTCPLAMTDGAAKTLLVHGHRALVERALPRLTDRNPETAWTSGQWMTERTGGSDVGLSETEARLVPSSDVASDWPVRDAGTPVYKLYGTKWFTSAITSQMALTLGRPEGAPPGGRGLALFYLEIDRPDGTRNGILVNRLKDKLGTRKVPTAELTLDGTVAVPVLGASDGVRAISPMLNITRTWNAVAAVAAMRRAIALGRDYASRRAQFGALLSDKPLHQATLADMMAEYEAGFHLTFRGVELLGREEAGALSPSEMRLLRLFTPLMKLVTGKQAVSVVSEALELFGGAGYVEDTGLPRMLRDAQVLPIWEGTTNVLSLDVLRALAKDGSFDAFVGEVASAAMATTDSHLVRVGKQAISAVEHAGAWISGAMSKDPLSAEAGGRLFALTLGRAAAAALLARHAEWALQTQGDRRPLAAAVRFASRGIDLIREGEDRELAALLARDEITSSGAR